MTLTQLNYIITIAETKSMNKAAEKLLCITAVADECDQGTGKRTWYYDILSKWARCYIDQ